jgi:hypothetical protein
MRRFFLPALFGGLMLLTTAAVVRADEIVPGHPRVSEIDRRLERQQNRTAAGVNGGQINARQEARDASADTRAARQLSRDEAANGGHITKGEQRQLNHELNHNSGRIYRQRHAK